MLLASRLFKQCVFLVILTLPYNSSTQEIPGDLSDSQWQLTSSKFECRLNNYIPGLGEIIVFAGAGKVENLFLSPDPYKPYSRDVEILLEQSPWQPEIHRYYIASGAFAKNQPSDLRVNVPYIVESFQKGMQLVVKINRMQLKPVTLKVPALNFGMTAKKFYHCFSELLVLNFEQAEETMIYYNSARHRLKAADKKHFRNLAEYILADKSVERIEIDAHTDSRGSDLANRELSKKRGEAIVNRLKQFGVPESKILARFHGERYPVASNETVAGRNKNRRVKIKLIRR